VDRLQRDGRIANVDLADAISLSPSACLRRVKALEASGIIAGYRAEVSRVRAGLGLTVFIGIKVEGHSQETSSRIEQALLAIPAVVACYLVSGSNDFLIEAAVPDLASYEQLLLGQILTIPSVVEAQSTFAIRTVLSRGPLPLDHWREPGQLAGPASRASQPGQPAGPASRASQPGQLAGQPAGPASEDSAGAAACWARAVDDAIPPPQSGRAGRS
jgi:Lrp/AsnC family leucine-responsive transcriptional regulator